LGLRFVKQWIVRPKYAIAQVLASELVQFECGVADNLQSEPIRRWFSSCSLPFSHLGKGVATINSIQ